MAMLRASSLRQGGSGRRCWKPSTDISHSEETDIFNQSSTLWCLSNQNTWTQQFESRIRCSKKHCAWKDSSLYISFIIALLPEDKYIQLKKHFRELYWLDLWEFHWKNDTFNRATSFLLKMLFMVFFSCNASQNLSLYGCSVCITLERPDRQFEPFSFLFSCYFGCAKWI